MSLDNAILGWLSTGPGSGYDLVRQMDLGLNWFWGAAHSQIYPRLKELEARGLISSEQITVGTKLEKRVYTITDAGREAVRKWTSEPPTYPPNRDNERLRLIFGDHGDLKAMRRHFETHLDHYERRRESLQEFVDVLTSRQHPRIEQRIAAAMSEALKEITLAAREMAYRGDLRRAEFEIEWAKECLAWLDDFERRHDLGETSGTDELPASVSATGT
ncbi:PadR family transcriptional regulator [Streptomyces sp. NPDC101455]|uniref:PadR family transcriptional regulator n=1 Tax=Streptomyces sp. NPDC101455 TaxID=3366142 RepID=UPI003829CC0F